MKAEFLFVGKTTEKYLQEGIEHYLKRLVHYLPSAIQVVSASAAGDSAKAIASESEVLLSKIKPRDFVVLLDERGTELTSPELAGKMQQWMVQGHSRIVFVTGGAFGFNEVLRQRANFTLSASRFTFTHQMIRLILLEQVYRAMTILKNEPYHHGG